MINEWLCDWVLEPHLDYLHEPPTSSPRSPRRPIRGSLLQPDPSSSTSRTTPSLPSTLPRRLLSRSTQTPTSPEAEASPLLALPIEVLSAILQEAALASTTADRDAVSSLTIDCLRPEAGVQQTMDMLPDLMRKFNAACKACMRVCRLFHAICIPFLWRDPFFSATKQGVAAFERFLLLLPLTTSVPFPPSLPAPPPFRTHVRTFSPLAGSLFSAKPSYLLRALPLLTHLTTLRLGSASGDMPLETLQQVSLLAPPSIRRLPDVFLKHKERTAKAAERLSAILTLASRCGELESLDVSWGHAMGQQLDHFLFVLKLQSFQRLPGGEGAGIRGSSLTSLALNEDCKVTVEFLDALPDVASRLSSFHLEVGSQLAPSPNEKSACFDVEAFVRKLPSLTSFSFTPTLAEVNLTTNFDALLHSHPRMAYLQLFLTSFSPLFTARLATASPPLPLRCLCLCTSVDDLSTLLVLRRPWRIHKVAGKVAEVEGCVGGLMGDVLAGAAGAGGAGGERWGTVVEQMRMDIWRRAELECVEGRGVGDRMQID